MLIFFVNIRILFDQLVLFGSFDCSIRRLNKLSASLSSCLKGNSENKYDFVEPLEQNVNRKRCNMQILRIEIVPNAKKQNERTWFMWEHFCWFSADSNNVFCIVTDRDAYDTLYYYVYKYCAYNPMQCICVTQSVVHAICRWQILLVIMRDAYENCGFSNIDI